MQGKKRKLKKALAAALVFIIACPCFLSAGRTAAYISDFSNTCENVFVGVTQAQTQTPHEQESETTVHHDTGKVSPPTGDGSFDAPVVIACIAFCAVLIIVSPKIRRKGK